jgi:hypothetical protein
MMSTYTSRAVSLGRMIDKHGRARHNFNNPISHGDSQQRFLRGLLHSRLHDAACIRHWIREKVVIEVQADDVCDGYLQQGTTLCRALLG